MKTLLSSEDYTSQLVFEHEQDAIFSRCWQFVGYRKQLASHNDWITADIAGKSVFIQNFDGDLRGYLNVCSHRFSRLRNEGAGNGKVQCPYHGWCYDANGLPCAIPSKPRFDDLSTDRMRALALQPVMVDAVGPFVFARLTPNGTSLRDYLGGAVSKLEEIGSAIGAQLDSVHNEIQANWKLVVENTLEGYHIDWVHGETFARLELQYPQFEFFGIHAASYVRAGPNALKSFSKIDNRFKDRPYRNEGYYHLVIFPNFGIATLYGMTFAVQRFRPVSATHTRLDVDLFGSVLGKEPTEFDRSFYKQYCESAVAFSHKVCGEDQVIVEMQQRGALTRQQDGILSDEEQRIGVFQKGYRHLLGIGGRQ